MTSYPLSLDTSAAFPSPIGGTPTKEGEVSMIRSLHARHEDGETEISYGFSGVTLASGLAGIVRGDRFQGRFQCSAGILGDDEAETQAVDEAASLSLVIGPHRLTSVGALTIHRLVTPQFYRISIRCEEFDDAPDGVKRVNLAFYSDPRYCAGDDFRLDRLDISKIPMPSLYIEAEDGEPMINAKLQSLDWISEPGA